MRRPRAARAGAGVATLLALLAGLPSCVTTVIDEGRREAPEVDMTPVVIPLGGARGAGVVGPVDQYYASVVAQMQEALAERELTRLRALIASHDRAGAPEWAAAQIAGFRAAALGLAFELHAAERGHVGLDDPNAPIGAPLAFTFRLPPLPEQTVDLGTGARLGFRATVTLVDHDATGARRENATSRILAAPQAVLAPDQPLELRFAADLPGADVTIREVHAAVELLPGAVRIGDVEAPVHRAPLAHTDALLYPAGVEPVRAAPLRTLQQAVAGGGERFLRHQYLAAHFMPPADRDAAAALLVQQVRLASDRAARVAMAALASMTGAELPIGDREAWLRWWQDRVSGR